MLAIKTLFFSVINLFCTTLQPEDLDAARKKTDEASPDDQEVEGEEKKAEGEDQIDVGPTGDNKKTKKSKAALEEQEDQVLSGF